jgi:hypothetical protein
VSLTYRGMPRIRRWVARGISRGREHGTPGKRIVNKTYSIDDVAWRAQTIRMSQTTAIELEKLGLDIARQIAGEDAVERVEVFPGVNFFDEPVYHFTFLIDPDRLRLRIGLVLGRVGQQIEDELTEHGDTHRADIRLLNLIDWPKRRRAPFG